MLKRYSLVVLAAMIMTTAVLAEEPTDQTYVNKLNYQRNKLQLIVKKRVVDETRNYSSTNINTTVYTYESYSQTLGNISTSSLSQAEAKEYTDWYIYKGESRELNDLEFLDLVGDKQKLAQIERQDYIKTSLRSLGNIWIGLGIITMVGGAAMSAGQAVVTGGALLTTGGFFISAFNLPPHHYILPDYAQERIDNYNVNLKKKLGLPIDLP